MTVSFYDSDLVDIATGLSRNDIIEFSSRILKLRI